MAARACDFGQASKDKHHFSLFKHSQKSSCLKCHKRGDALVCNNWECPIIVHKSCMPSAAHFDDTGRFHCPYCFYKQSLVECHQAKAKAFLANRTLVRILDTRTRNCADHLEKFKCLKRKKPDAPTIMKKRDESKVECNGVHQHMQVEGGHQDDSQFVKTLSGNLQQAGPTRDRCLGKGSSSKNDGNLTKIIQQVKGVKSGSLEEVQLQTQASLTVKENTKEIHEKSENKSDSMLDNDLSMEIIKVRKSAKAGRFHYNGDFGTTDEDKLQVKSPNNDVLPTRVDNALLKHPRNSTSELEETVKTVEEYFNIGVERKQTQTDFRETPCCLEKKNTLEVNESLHKGNDCAFQDEYFVGTQVVENFDRSCEIGDFIGRIDEGERKEKLAVHSMRNNRESLLHGGLGNPIVKRLEIEQNVESYHDRVVEKVQTPEEPKEISVFCKREDNPIVINEKSDDDEIKDSAYQDDHSAVRQMMINSGNVIQCDGVGKHQGRMTYEGRTNLTSPVEPSYVIKEDNESAKQENSGIPIKENEKRSKPVERYYNGQVKKEQTLEESQECCVCLTEESTTEMNKESSKVKDGTFWEETIKNSENVDQPAKDCFGNVDGIITPEKALDDVVCPTRENNAAVTHEFVNLTRKHSGTKKILEGCHDRVAEIEQMQTKLRSTRDDDKKEMVEESGAENYSLSCCGMTDDEKTRVKSLKVASQITRNGSVSVSCENESSNTNYLDRGKFPTQKRKLPKKVNNVILRGEYIGNSDDEVEECVQSKHKVESTKKIQWSTLLPVERRRKLPWTAQEVEMLKEGVKKFSATANKNLPWMKILDYGLHIFEGTRTPADLKDKWRNIKGKENANFDPK